MLHRWQGRLPPRATLRVDTISRGSQVALHALELQRERCVLRHVGGGEDKELVQPTVQLHLVEGSTAQQRLRRFLANRRPVGMVEQLLDRLRRGLRTTRQLPKVAAATRPITQPLLRRIPLLLREVSGGAAVCSAAGTSFLAL